MKAASAPRISKGYWDASVRHLLLLRPDQVLMLVFRNTQAPRGVRSSIHTAAARAGLRVSVKVSGAVLLSVAASPPTSLAHEIGRRPPPATKATGLRRPPPKNKNTERACEGPLLLLPLPPCAGFAPALGQKLPAAAILPGKAHSARGGAAPRKEPGHQTWQRSQRRAGESPAPPFCGGPCCWRCWHCCPLPVSLCVLASGHTRRCLRHPTGKTPGRRGCRACSPTSARDRRPSGDLGGSRLQLSVCCPGVASAVPAVRFLGRRGPETVPR
jgi:hypothetical protein